MNRLDFFLKIIHNTRSSLFLPRGGNFRLTKQTNKQNTMKNKLLALLASVGLVASASAVEINENLSINGFIDGSYKANDMDQAASNGQEIGSTKSS